jgi:hypothetical protein
MLHSIRRKLFSTRKRIALSVAVLLLLMGGTAFAAWTLEANGSGTANGPGTAAAGNAPAVTPTIVVSGSPLTPAGTADNVDWMVNQTSGNNENLSGVVVAVTTDSNTTTCPVGNFVVTQGTAANGGSTLTYPYQWPTGYVLADNNVQSGANATAGIPATVNLISSAPVGCESLASYTVSVTFS